MTTMNDFKDFSDMGDAILHPAISHQWKIYFSGSKRIVLPSNILTVQAVSCKLNMLRKKAFVHIEQSTLGLEYYQLENLHREIFTTRIDVFTGSTLGYAMVLHGCRLSKHQHDFNYKIRSEALFHDLVIKYKDYEILTVAIPPESPTEPTGFKHNLQSPGVSVTVED